MSHVRIYCDESCHLLRDNSNVMVLGCVWQPAEKSREIAERIREIKVRHRHKKGFEVKWTKVSTSQIDFYQDLIDYFLDDDDLHFRALVVPDKQLLRHDQFQQNHDDWYYKMYFNMLKVVLDPEDSYEIFLDIKDTRSASKVRKLREVLCNNMYDFSRSIIDKIQNVRSHQVEQVQLADLLIGAITYANRGLETSEAKLKIIERLRKRSGYSLTRSTLMLEDKVNILVWRGRKFDEQ